MSAKTIPQYATIVIHVALSDEALADLQKGSDDSRDQLIATADSQEEADEIRDNDLVISQFSHVFTAFQGIAEVMAERRSEASARGDYSGIDMTMPMKMELCEGIQASIHLSILDRSPFTPKLDS